jgi:hypothetical protein
MLKVTVKVTFERLLLLLTLLLLTAALLLLGRLLLLGCAQTSGACVMSLLAFAFKAFT